MLALVNDLKSPTREGAIRQHDIVAFQEMWSEETFLMFRSELASLYPHSQLYRHGVIGTGLAIFSKHPIRRIDFRPYALNGRPTGILTGDWFAGKGVAYSQIAHPRGLIDIYNTHLIADYSDRSASVHVDDDLLAHRIAQLHALVAQVGRNHNPARVIATIALGDFNTEVTSMPWKALVGNGSACLLASIFDGISDYLRPCTCNCPENGYSRPGSVAVTIDNILYDPKSLLLTSHKVAFKRSLAESAFSRTAPPGGAPEPALPRSFSDHFGVAATFKFAPSPHAGSARQAGAAKREASVHAEKALEQAQMVVQAEVAKVHRMHSQSLSSLIVCGALLLLVYLLSASVLAKPPTGPRWIHTWCLLLAIPLVSTITINCLLHWIAYPSELMALYQFLSEVDYAFDS